MNDRIRTLNRRNFHGTTTLAAAGLTILPGGLRAAPANNKLNIALIGVHGRARALYESLATKPHFPALQPSPRLRPTGRSGHRLSQRPPTKNNFLVEH